MESLLATKRTLQSKTSRLEISIKDQADLLKDPASCSVYIDRANDLLKICDDLLDNISLQCTEEEFKQHETDIASCSSTLERLKLQLLKSSQAQKTAESRVPAVEVKLPKLELPVFDGNLDEWLSFRDLFIAAVHDNTGLTGAQKLQYLKASLRGDAAVLLQSVSITNDNYEQAWGLLNNRYQNRRELVTSTLKRLINHPPIDSESPAKLRKLVDNTMECNRSLKVMDVPVESWDVIISHLLVDKLDPASKEQWELNIKSGDIPPLKDLMEFLDKRSRALSNITSRQRRDVPQASSSALRSVLPTGGCPMCQRNHYLHKCIKFINISLEEKNTFLKDSGLCSNCFRIGHDPQQCNSGCCHVCGQRHHTLLCNHK